MNLGNNKTKKNVRPRRDGTEEKKIINLYGNARDRIRANELRGSGTNDFFFRKRILCARTTVMIMAVMCTSIMRVRRASVTTRVSEFCFE